MLHTARLRCKELTDDVAESFNPATSSIIIYHAEGSVYISVTFNTK